MPNTQARVILLQADVVFPILLLIFTEDIALAISSQGTFRKDSLL